MRHRRKHDRHYPRGWFNLFLRLGGWVCLVAGVALLALTGISASRLYMADRLDAGGGYSAAVVTDKRYEQSTDSDGDTSTTYYVTFTYKGGSAGGQTVETTVGSGFYDDVMPQDRRVIRYLRDDPRVIEYEPGRYRRIGNTLRYIGLAVGLLGLAALWMLGQQTNRAIKARRDGDRRIAVVIDIRDTNVEVNDRPQARLVWREDDGKTGQSLMRGEAELRRLYAPGDKIVVFRLGRHAFWEGDVGPPRREVQT
jgi:hypothetical protein